MLPIPRWYRSSRSSANRLMFWFSACYRRRNVWFALLVLCAGQRRNPQGWRWVEKSHCNRMRECKLCFIVPIKIFNVLSHHCPLQCVLAPSAGRSHRSQSARFMWSFGAWRNCLLRQALDDRQAGAGGGLPHVLCKEDPVGAIAAPLSLFLCLWLQNGALFCALIPPSSGAIAAPLSPFLCL